MKTKLALSLVLVIALMSSSIISPLAAVSADAGLYPYLRILESLNSGLRIQFEPPNPQVISKEVNGSSCQQVKIEGLLPSSDLELPPLPVQGVMLGIPADAQPQVRILRAESASLTGSYELCPQEVPYLETQPDGSAWQAPVQSFESARDALQPLEVVELVETGFIRSQAYLQLRLNPVQYNPQSGEVKFISRIEFAVDFNTDGAQLEGSQEVISEGTFEQQLEAQLLNYQQAIKWREQPSQFAAPQASLTYTGNFYKVQVDQDGIFQLTYENLLQAGLPVNEIDPTTFKLFDRGIPIALGQLDNGDAFFESGESLLFYGQILDGVYGKSNVYWLTWGGEAGQRIQDQPGTPVGGFEVPQSFQTTRHFEQNKTYYSNRASGDPADNWYWGVVFDGSPIAARQFKVNLGIIPESNGTSMAISGLLRGHMGTPFHRAKIFLNGTLLGNVEMLPNTWIEFSFPNVSQSLLLAGENVIEIQTPLEDGLTLNAVLVNWFEITYNDAYTAQSDQLTFDGDQAGSWQFEVDGFSGADLEVYDISEPTSPRVVSGFMVEASPNGQKLSFEASIAGESRYLAQTTAKRLNPTSITADAPSSWGTPANSADYLILSHASFLAQAQALADYRSGQGFLTAVIDVQDIYDEFNDGELSPLAIQEFLRFAYANWSTPKPAYLVLFGDGHFDYFNNYVTNETNFIPPFLADVDPFQGEVAADNRYAMVSGTDILPDLHVGRLPVRTTAEAAAVVQKIINYETTEPVNWNEAMTFVADNADDGGQYATDADTMISTYVPVDYSAEKVYYGITHPTASGVKTALLGAINSGRLIVHYAGHAGIQKWGDENFLAVADVLALNNADKLPFVLPMTCLEGNFSYPSPVTNINKNASIGESFVRKTVGGAIASWSPTGLGLHSGHMILEADLLDNLFNEYHNQVGYLTTEAKYHLFASTSGYRDLIDSYILFGDPALRLQNIPVPLEAPSSLTAAVVSWDKIALSWTDNSATETNFRIERSLDGETGWQQIAEVGADVTSYMDSGLDELTPYHYRVRAFREADLAISDYTNAANATTLSYLNAPSDLAATVVTTDKINLTWTDNSITEDSFRIERSLDGLSGWVQIAEVDPNIATYADTGLTAFTPYYYRVYAYRLVDDLSSEFTNIATATTLTLLSAPTNLVVSIVSDTWLTLDWQETNVDESALLVERSLDGMDWQQIAELDPGTTSYTDTGLTPLTPYYYQVRAYRTFDDLYSDYSDPVMTATLSPLTPPTDLIAAVVSWDKIALSWTDNSDSESSFRIERSLDGETDWQQVGEVNASVTTFMDTSLSELTPYFYRVRAYRETDLALSEASNIATATTLEFLDAPSQLVASASCGGSVLLSWQDNSLDESAFQLENSPNGEDGWELLDELPPNTTAYQDSLLPGAGSYYRVRVYREADQMVSEYSGTVFAFMNYCSFLPQINGGTP